MIEKTIRLKKFTDVAEFVKLAGQCPGEVWVYCGRWIVSGKSIMGMYSLDLCKDLKVEIEGDIPTEVREKMKNFIVG